MWPGNDVVTLKTRQTVIDGPVDTLPVHMIKTEIRPDKAAIKSALEDGEHVPGWHLSNGGQSVTVRRK